MITKNEIFKEIQRCTNTIIKSGSYGARRGGGIVTFKREETNRETTYPIPTYENKLGRVWEF